MNAHFRGGRGTSRLRLGLIFLLALAIVFIVRWTGWPVDSATESPIGLTVEPLNSHSAQLSWTTPDGTTTLMLERRESGETEWRHIDTVPSSTTSYTDYLLWRSTSYAYRVTAVGAAGSNVETKSAGIPTPVANERFPRLYSPTSVWNTPIDKAEAEYEPDARPEDIGSRMIQYAFTGEAKNSNLVADHEFGQSLVYANPSSDTYTVGCDDPLSAGCFTETPLEFRFPKYANLDHETEAEPPQTINGARNDGDDQKLTVIEPAIEGNPVTGSEFGMFQAAYAPLPVDTWTSESRSISPAAGSGIVPCATTAEHCTGPTASGFNNMAGVIRPEEIADGEIRHALAIGTPHAYAGFIACPATKSNGGEAPQLDPDTGEQTTFPIPLGTRVQLRPGVTIPSTWPEAVQHVVTALQTYGAYIRDNSGTITIAAENDIGRGYPVWKDSDEQLGKIRDLTGNQDRIFLDHRLDPPFPWDQLRILKIVQNTGSPGTCQD